MEDERAVKSMYGGKYAGVPGAFLTAAAPDTGARIGAFHCFPLHAVSTPSRIALLNDYAWLIVLKQTAAFLGEAIESGRQLFMAHFSPEDTVNC